MINREQKIAEDFILYTNRCVFLTGKAGTGKTTFLKEIIQKTDKNTAIVAPTGVAAINAGGMTIHSMFQLPISSFVPSHQAVNPDSFTNRTDLGKKQKVRKERRRVLMELDLLIIDEISMVRADILDAVDYTLRRFRKNALPFGGVQLLVIGDLYQLAPVIKPYEWSVLNQYYDTPFFFSSIAWKEVGALTIELQNVYRQSDEKFISILNNIRNGVKLDSDVNELNDRFSHKAIAAETITLTTHNRKANAINETELKRLDSKEHKLRAKITGQFNESAYPTPETIILKEGCQVMFIRNHSEGLYYNGKIGTISKIDKEDIFVKCEGENNSLLVEPIEWKNTRYVVNESDNSVEPEDIGSFTQYPLRLAWSVTVHKSQGLTFDKVIVDLEDTFAPGQLYVALSRCRSLEGLILSSRIHVDNIIIDHRVKNYMDTNILPNDVHHELKIAKQLYENHKLRTAFHLHGLIEHMEHWEELITDKNIPSKSDVFSIQKSMKKKVVNLNQTADTFNRVLTSLMKTDNDPDAKQTIIERSQKGIHYFIEEIYNKIIKPLEDHRRVYMVKPNTRTYLRDVEEIIAHAWAYVESLYALKYNEEPLHLGDIKYKKIVLFNPNKTKKETPKREKGETYKTTQELWENGKSIDEIAKIRSMASSTIHTHLTKLIKEKKISIFEVMDEERVKSIISEIQKHSDELSTTELKSLIPFNTSYEDLRMVKGHLETLV